MSETVFVTPVAHPDGVSLEVLRSMLGPELQQSKETLLISRREAWRLLGNLAGVLEATES